MQSEYFDIYKKRLDRYGTDYQSRMQGMRERQFDLYLARSVYKTEFEWNSQTVVGSLERYQQTNSKTIQYLLTYIDINIPQGTILEIPDKDGNLVKWLVYYLESIKASGYNRYIVLKMTHHLEWKDRDGVLRESWAYMYGQENNMLKDELKSRSRMDTVYNENLKSSFFIMPLNQYIKKDIYMTIGSSPYTEGYRVTGYDIQSTEGVMYVTVDPVYLYDETPPPQPTPSDPEEDFYWINGGVQ